MSLHDIGVELLAELRAQGCPLVVLDGPEATATATFGRERIVIEHDDGGDRFGPARSQSVNPKRRMTRLVGVKVTIYAQSTRAGAQPFEHRARAEQILDVVLVALELVAANRRNRIEFTSGRFSVPDDLSASERHGGAVYELTFTIERAVVAQTWAGAAQGEAVLDTVITTADAAVVTAPGA